MAVSASDVAAVLRDRHPQLPTKKLHKLLYYCQGHHLAAFGTPLFEETISAWDMGPVVGTLWYAEKNAGRAELTTALGEAELNTVGYVLARYGGLTGQDLESLTHSEQPWQLADARRQPHGSARIEIEWIRRFFTTTGSAGDEDDVVLDSAQVAGWLREAGQRREDRSGRAVAPDTPEVLEERLTELRSRLRA